MNSTPEMATDNLQKQAFNHLKSFYGLDDQTVEMLLVKAKNALSEDLQSLQAAAGENDLEKVKKIAHAIKGALLNLGLKELSTLAIKIEQASSLDAAMLKTFVELMDSSGLV